MVTLSVVVLTLNNKGYILSIISQLEAQTKLPLELIVINNGSMDGTKEVLEKYSGPLNLIVINHEKNIGVNPAWNEGFDIAKGDLVGIWNDDILFSNTYVETICEEFEKGQWGILVPTTDSNKEDYLPSVNKDVNTQIFNGREGWMFTVRKSVFKKIFPIPIAFKFWFGDDFLFLCCRLSKQYIGKMYGCRISHFGSKTTIAEFGTATEANLPWAKNERHYWNVYLSALQAKGIINK